MFERDFIMRMIRQLAQVLSQILNYKKSGQWKNAQMVIDVACKQLLGLNPEIVERLNADALSDLFTYNNETDYEKCLTLAILLTEQAEIYKNTNQTEDKIFSLYSKGFHLYKAAFKDQQLHSENNIAYAVLCCDMLTEYKLQTNLQLELFSFYKQFNYFAKAENMLYQLINQNEEDAREHAIKFYKNLLKCDDKTLVKGNLPRNEVLEGLERIDKESRA